MTLSILYRGPLASCNYRCDYCPFAKRRDSRQTLASDRQQLQRFVDWVERRRNDRIGVLFTPWGEALVRRWYRDAIVRMSQWPNIARVAIQTNLSGRLDWLQHCNRQTTALWCTWHPTQTPMARFIDQCQRLDQLGIRYSVGVVGLREHIDAIDALRHALPATVYLWVNAYKREADYYCPADIDRLAAVDPLFELNLRRHPSHGRACRAGHTVISVAGDGSVRRCHFIDAPIANIYAADFDAALRPRRCSQQSCGCHIGYVHLRHLDLYRVFGDGVLERIPDRPVTRQDAVELMKSKPVAGGLLER